MGLMQNIVKTAQNIAKHSLETALVLTLSTSLSCKSLSIVTDNFDAHEKKSVFIEKIIKQDFEKLPREYIQKYNTTTHKLIQMEKEFGANSEHYVLLDMLIKKAKSEFDTSSYGVVETIATLKKIGEMLRPFQIEPEKPRSSLISKCLEDMRLDCDGLSLVYLAIGEEINLPMQLAMVPGHIFLRINTEEGPINWDAAMISNNRVISDEKYVDEDHIDNWPKILDTKGIFALQYSNLSGEWLNKYYQEWQKNNGIENEEGLTYLKKGLDNANKAIELFPEFFGAHYNKGAILFCMQDYDNSLESFQKAGSLWNNESRVLMGQGQNYYQLSEHNKALELLTDAIEMNPMLMPAYYLRARIWYEKGDEQKALADLKIAIDLVRESNNF